MSNNSKKYNKKYNNKIKYLHNKNKKHFMINLIFHKML